MQQEHDRIKMLILSNQKPAQYESVRARQPSACLVDQGDFWMGLVAEPSAKLCTNPLCLQADHLGGWQRLHSLLRGCCWRESNVPCSYGGPQGKPLKHCVKGWHSKEDFSSLVFGAWERALTPTTILSFTGSSQEREQQNIKLARYIWSDSKTPCSKISV